MNTVRSERRKDEAQAREEEYPRAPRPDQVPWGDLPPVDIPPNDPVVAYFQSAKGPVDIEALQLQSPGVDSLRSAGVKMAVPLVSQGELIGLLNLGPRLSEQDYSGDEIGRAHV